LGKVANVVGCIVGTVAFIASVLDFADVKNAVHIRVAYVCGSGQMNGVPSFKARSAMLN
jgi:hypothetical protein